MNIIFHVNDTIAVGVVRGDVLARAINSETEHSAVCKTELFLSDLLFADVIVFQRSSSLESLDWMQRAKAMGVKVVYDIDDDLFVVPKILENPHKYYSSPEVQQRMRHMMTEAHLVTVSTPTLAKNALPVLSHKVIRNCVDLGHTRIPTNRPKPTGVTIMWHGSETHLDDMPVVKGALKRVLKDWNGVARLELIGHFTEENTGREFAGLPVTYRGWLPPTELYQGLRVADIGLAPLADNQFNRGKSEIKWVEYGAVGVPTVATWLDPYKVARPYTDILPVEGGTEDEWYEKLSLLVKDEPLRLRIGAEAKIRVLEGYDSRQRIKEWLDALR